MSETERARFLENIAGSSKRLRMLLERLLGLARAENSDPATRHLTLLPIVQRVVGQQSVAAEISVHISPGLKAMITEEALEIVLGNLIENAAQHGADRISITAERGERVELRVRDNGVGITAANRARIFEHFFTTRRESGGTGLGLGIVNAILVAHGGEIHLNEAVLTGAEFRILLRT